VGTGVPAAVALGAGVGDASARTGVGLVASDGITLEDVGGVGDGDGDGAVDVQAAMTTANSKTDERANRGRRSGIEVSLSLAGS
jgi:hypothetical protein